MATPKDELELRRAFAVVERHVRDRYGIPVSVTDVPAPNTGDFDGAEIKLDRRNDREVMLFVLAHLFGHTVQWTTTPRLRELGIAYANAAPPEELFPEVRAYERDASRLAVQLFREAGVAGFEQWLSDWAAADWSYLEHFYRTGERVDFKRFWKEGSPLLAPLSIPPFKPVRFVSRYSF